MRELSAVSNQLSALSRAEFSIAAVNASKFKATP
jgi:hypothetical protein